MAMSNAQEMLKALMDNGMIELVDERSQDKNCVHIMNMDSDEHKDAYLYFSDDGQFKELSLLDPESKKEYDEKGYYSYDLLVPGKESVPYVGGVMTVNDGFSSGTYDVSFPRVKDGYELHDSEIKALLDSKPIVVPTSSGDKVYEVKPDLDPMNGYYDPHSYLTSYKGDETPFDYRESPQDALSSSADYRIETRKNGKDYVIGQMDVDGEKKEVSFAKTYGSHEFDDAEIKSLLNGEEVTIPLRSGDAPVKLGEGSYMGHSYFGVQRADIPEKSRRLPDISDVAQTSPTVDKQAGE